MRRLIVSGWDLKEGRASRHVHQREDTPLPQTSEEPYALDGLTDYYQHFERLSHWWRRETYKLVADIVHRSIPRGGKVLDAGCGPGNLMKLLAAQYKMTGLDSWDRAVGVARRNGFPLIARGDIERLPFARATFDGVVSLDALSHASVEDDGRALEEFRRVLRPGGWIIVNLPAYQWMRSAHDDFVHTARRYTARRVRHLFADARLSVERVTYRNTLLFPFAVVQGRVLRLKDAGSLRMPDWLDRALGTTLALEKYWLRHAGFPFGLSVLAVGRKPCP